ncbi:MAG: hypothetical protein ABW175_16115 [Bradyrhizobium sp.]
MPGIDPLRVRQIDRAGRTDRCLDAKWMPDVNHYQFASAHSCSEAGRVWRDDTMVFVHAGTVRAFAAISYRFLRCTPHFTE